MKSHCPVCFTPLQKGKICIVCGYVESLDYDSFLTLGPACEEATPLPILHETYMNKVIDARVSLQLEAQQKLLQQMASVREEELTNSLEDQKAEILGLINGQVDHSLDSQKQELLALMSRQVTQILDSVNPLTEKIAGLEAQVAALKAENTQIDSLKAEIAQIGALKAEIEALKSRSSNGWGAAANSSTGSSSWTRGTGASAGSGSWTSGGTASTGSGSWTGGAASSGKDTGSGNAGESETAGTTDDGTGLRLEVGEKLVFGMMHSTSYGSDSMLTWQILKVEGARALIITEKGIDCRRFHNSNKKIKWDGCSLRHYLNGDFIQNCFTKRQRDRILMTKVENLQNGRYLTMGCGYTSDRVFLLSIDEATKYFSGDKFSRCAKVTSFAKQQGVFTDQDTGNCWWWLRSPGVSDELTAIVLTDGSINHGGTYVSNTGGAVRPAMWIDLDGIKTKSDLFK